MRHNILILTITVILFSFISCNKNNDSETGSQPSEIVKGDISGNIIIPSDVTVDLTSLNVHSPIDAQALNGNQYKVNAFVSSVSTLLVLNSQDNVILMGYNPIGETVKDISVETTALALVMNTIRISSLSENAKKQIIPTVLSNAAFSALVVKVKQNLIAGTDLFGDTSPELLLKIKDVIENVANRSPMDLIVDGPVDFRQEGRKLTFYKENSSITTVIGIYKNGQRLEGIEVEGVAAFPSSIADLSSGIGHTAIGSQISQHSYTLPEDGSYQIKMRTGLPIFGNDTQEYEEALTRNCLKAALYALDAYIPIFKKIKGRNLSCLTAVGTNLYSLIHDSQNITTAQAVMLKVYAFTMDHMSTIVGCVFGIDENFDEKYFGKFGKWFSIFDTFASFTGNTMNLGAMAVQWVGTTPVYDGCYNVNGENVTTCCNETSVTDIDGNVYAVTNIDGKCWMQTDLNVTHFKNGDEIPQISPADWNAQTGPGWCNGANGKLYNYAAVTDPRGLAPEGWHVLNNSEATYIAANSSGLNATVTGFVLDCNQCNTGTYVPGWSNWWAFSGNAILTYDSGFMFPFNEFGSGYYQIGCAVRCVKN